MRQIPPVTDKRRMYLLVWNSKCTQTSWVLWYVLLKQQINVCVWPAGYGVEKDEGRKLAIVFAQTDSPWYI